MHTRRKCVIGASESAAWCSDKEKAEVNFLVTAHTAYVHKGWIAFSEMRLLLYGDNPVRRISIRWSVRRVLFSFPRSRADKFFQRFARAVNGHTRALLFIFPIIIHLWRGHFIELDVGTGWGRFVGNNWMNFLFLEFHEFIICKELLQIDN